MYWKKKQPCEQRQVLDEQRHVTLRESQVEGGKMLNIFLI